MEGVLYRAARRFYHGVDRGVLSRLDEARAAQLRQALRNLGGGLLRRPAGAASAATAPASAWRPPALPDWAIAEMRVQSELEPELFPSSEALARFEYYSTPYDHEAPGRAYARLYLEIAKLGPCDHWLIAPWVKVGGADKALIAHARALASDFGHRVLVLATEDTDSPWADRLPPGCAFVGAGPALGPLAMAEQATVLTRLILQRAPRAVHVFNSLAGWSAYRAHGLALRQQSRLYASLFCDDITPEGERVGYARSFARDCAPVLDAVLTDCRSFAEQLHREVGLARDRLHPVYLPVEQATGAALAPAAEAGRPRILWAGRLDRQKRPDVLAAIAAACPELDFDVFGQSVIPWEKSDLAALRGLANVRLQGAYDGFDSLPWRDAAAFLYTSQWDGLPNVVLEAAARGLPVVAPAVGGLPELLPPEEGCLVPACDDVAGHANALRRIVAMDSGARATLVARVLDRIEKRHRWPVFVAALQRVPAYAA